MYVIVCYVVGYYLFQEYFAILDRQNIVAEDLSILNIVKLKIRVQYS